MMITAILATISSITIIIRIILSTICMVFVVVIIFTITTMSYILVEVPVRVECLLGYQGDTCFDDLI